MCDTAGGVYPDGVSAVQSSPSPTFASLFDAITANVASVVRLVYPGSRYSFAGRFQA